MEEKYTACTFFVVLIKYIYSYVLKINQLLNKQPIFLKTKVF